VQGQVAVLAWDTHKCCPAVTSLHAFPAAQMPLRGRTVYPCSPVARPEPSGKAAALLLYQSVLAVLPAIAPGAKQGVAAPLASAAVGNSFVIDLTQHGIRVAKDFAFLHEYAPFHCAAFVALRVHACMLQLCLTGSPYPAPTIQTFRAWH
jgi:hypothetical protein